MDEDNFHAVLRSLSAAAPPPGVQPRELRRAAVIGAGPVGQALACELLAAGVEVRLCSSFDAEVEGLAAAGAITVRGAHLAGSYRVTTTPGDTPAIELCSGVDHAVEGADAVFIATPALAHQTYAGLLSGVLVDDTLVVLVPGRSFGAVAFEQVLRRHACRADVTILELASAPYLALAPTFGGLQLLARKAAVAVGGLPAARTVQAVATLKPVLPALVAVDGVLHSTFANLGGVLNVAPVVLNTALLEQDRPVAMYHDLVTRTTAQTVLVELDVERREVAFAYGVRDLPDAATWLSQTYGVDGADLYECLQAVEAYDEVPPPASVTAGGHLLDEVPNSLVPIASAGRRADVSTPTTDALIAMASLLAHVDFTRHGRTLEALGLDGRSPDDIRRTLAAAPTPRTGG